MIGPLPWDLSVLALLAIATTVIFIVAVAVDTRRRDESPWV